MYKYFKDFFPWKNADRSTEDRIWGWHQQSCRHIEMLNAGYAPDWLTLFLHLPHFQQPFYTQQLKGIKIPWAHKVIP